MNDLLRKDLCARFPYKLKLWDFKSLPGDEVFELAQLYIPKGGEILLGDKDDNLNIRLEDVKPILFPSLTESITIAGKNFVPLDKIFIPDGHDMEIVFHRKDSECLDFYTRYVGSDSSEEHFTLWLDEWWNYPCWVIDKMNELHINYRLPETDFVAVTEDFNPYR